MSNRSASLLLQVAHGVDGYFYRDRPPSEGLGSTPVPMRNKLIEEIVRWGRGFETALKAKATKRVKKMVSWEDFFKTRNILEKEVTVGLEPGVYTFGVAKDGGVIGLVRTGDLQPDAADSYEKAERLEAETYGAALTAEYGGY